MNTVSLNYVWINAVPHNHGVVTRACHDPDRVECPIPQRYLQNVRNVRQKYPDIDITIWMDAYKHGDREGELSRAFAKSVDVDRVTFRGLREIPEYREDNFFDMSVDPKTLDTRLIWQQVDLARLIVLRQGLENNQGICAYSDFDIIDPPVDTEAIVKTKKHGVVIAKLFGGFDCLATCPSAVPLENTAMSFFGQASVGKTFLNTAISRTRDYYEFNQNEVANGWKPFCDAVNYVKMKLMPQVLMSDLNVVCKTLPKDHSDYPGFEC